MIILLVVVFIVGVYAESYDFTKFEDKRLKLYLESYSLEGKSNNEGKYSFFGKDDIFEKRTTTLYGSTDILFTLFIVNQLNLTESEKDTWSDTINSFQNETDGSYSTTKLESDLAGYEPWHAAAYAVAALKLIDRKPKYPLKLIFDVVDDKNATYWEDYFNPLLSPLPDKKHYSIWQTSHKIAAFPSIIINLGLTDEYTEFMDWWFEWLVATQNTQYGYWGTDKDWYPPKHDAMGGSFHMWMIFSFLKIEWYFPSEVMNSTISLQHSDGLFDPKTTITYCIDLDGVFSIARSSLILQKFEWDVVKNVCTKYLKEAKKILNDELLRFLPYVTLYSHLLPGAVAAVAECQKQFPDLVVTENPWRQVVDYVPYV